MLRTRKSRALAAACLSIAATMAWGARGFGGDETSKDRPGGAAAGKDTAPTRGSARADVARPRSFPHRIWAASDFEARLPDYAWFGRPEAKDIPAYPGNVTALRDSGAEYEKVSARMAGINPVPGPRMGKVNHLYCRYKLTGATEATFQHFSLTREDNCHIRVSGLTEGAWSELTLNFTRDSARNDGSAEPFADGERMDDLKVFAGKPGAKGVELLLDDIIFYADDPALPPDEEPFPRRVIYVAAFDTGVSGADVKKYFPGDLEVATRDLPAGSYWNAARAVPRKDGRGKLVSLQLEPPRPAGARTRLRFRYHLRGASAMTVQVFDLTVEDNRHVRLTGLRQGEWASARVDFSRDSRRNDGSAGQLPAGNLLDHMFFFLEADEGKEAELLLDEVVLYDGSEK